MRPMWEQEDGGVVMKEYFKQALFFNTISDIVRLCPICGEVLDFHDFVERNTEPYDIIFRENKIIELNKQWKDKRIAIPCCSCFDLLKRCEDEDKKIDIPKFIKAYEIGHAKEV